MTDFHFEMSVSGKCIHGFYGRHHVRRRYPPFWNLRAVKFVPLIVIWRMSTDAAAGVANRPSHPHINSMTPTRNSDEARERRAALLERKILQTAEARAAMADYHRSNQARLDLTVKLKAERLARQALQVEAASKKSRRQAKAA